MPAVVCPSCLGKLKASPQLAGKRATCPRCKAAVRVPSDGDSLLTRPVLPDTSADTAESAALDGTAEQTPIKTGTAKPLAEPVASGPKWSVVALRLVLLVALATAATFSLWMAVPENPASRASQSVQSRP
jgi:hypothetical protein